MPSLPSLREELELLPGPVARNGQPTWTVHDPVRNLFFRIDWLSFEILSRWSLGDPAAIIESIRTATTLQPAVTDVVAVAQFLAENELIAPRGAEAAAHLARQKAARHGGWLRQALHHYLFFRIPLLRPDRWLTRLAPFVAPLGSRGFLGLTAAVLAVGGFLAWRQADAFITTLGGVFTPTGFLSYGAAIFVVKIAHELGHAFTAKRAGCRVPTMGVAFLVMWPVAYTDTNDTWRLTRRRDRLRVALAGVATELVIGAWALLAWGLLPSGTLKTACFVLSTTSLAATLAVNASPFIRFDGYFVLSDWLDFPNLHQRSFALARWRLREALFAFGHPKPEHLPPRLERGLILFAWATWIYRLVVFLGIAALVYHFFIKVVGIFLFLVEIGWFVALPIGRELAAWATLHRHANATAASRRRTWATGLGALALIALAFVPWPGRVRTIGLLEPGRTVPIYTAAAGRIAQHVDGDALLAPGATVLRLDSPETESHLRLSALEAYLARWRADRAALSAELRPSLPVAERQAQAAARDRQRWEDEKARLTFDAPFAGRARRLDPDLTTGAWVAGRQPWGSFVGEGPGRVETYLDEEQLKHVAVGQRGIFQLESASTAPVRVRVTRIERDAAHVLTDARFGAPAGGHVSVRPAARELVPEVAVYRVELEVEDPLGALAASTWRGALVLRTEPYSPLRRYLNQALSVLLREAGW